MHRGHLHGRELPSKLSCGNISVQYRRVCETTQPPSWSVSTNDTYLQHLRSMRNSAYPTGRDQSRFRLHPTGTPLTSIGPTWSPFILPMSLFRTWGLIARIASPLKSSQVFSSLLLLIDTRFKMQPSQTSSQHGPSFIVTLSLSSPLIQRFPYYSPTVVATAMRLSSIPSFYPYYSSHSYHPLSSRAPLARFFPPPTKV